MKFEDRKTNIFDKTLSTKIHGAQICKDPNKTVTDKKLHEFGIRKTGLEQLF